MIGPASPDPTGKSLPPTVFAEANTPHTGPLVYEGGMATTPHDRKPSRPDHWCHIEYHPGPPAGRWRTTCECGWISNWSATSAGLLELLPLDGRLRPVGTRTVASFVTSDPNP